MPTLTPTPTASPTATPDRVPFSPVEESCAGQCNLLKLVQNNKEIALNLRCTLPAGARVYAAADGRVEIAGSAPWLVLNLFYPDSEKGFLIYRLHGDWDIVVPHGQQVSEGDLLAVARQPISDSQSESLVLGRGQFAQIGFADVELPAEIVQIWQ